MARAQPTNFRARKTSGPRSAWSSRAPDRAGREREPKKGRRPQMMRQYDLIDRVKTYNPTANEDLLNRAYVYAMKAHGSQTRASGRPYFSHPLEVAAILTDLKLDDATIVAALLHDTIEDTEATRAEIDEKFGTRSVRWSTADQAEEARPGHPRGKAGREPAQAAARDRRRRARAADQLADRPAQHAHARFHAAGGAPAHRRGDDRHLCAARRRPWACMICARNWRNLAFHELQPEAFALISGKLAALAARSQKVVAEIERQLTKKLTIAACTRCDRAAEAAYSTWRKMERKAIGFEQLSDLVGYRVLVDTLQDCYQALGIVHTPGR